MDIRSGTRVLVQRGKMGGRTIYTAQLTLREQMSLVPPRPESGSLDDREQRLTDPAHSAEIAHYIAEVDDYYLPGLMAFLHDEPHFEPLADSDGKVLTERIGFIWIDGKVGRSLGDGMHRGMGVDAAVSADEDGELEDDTIVVSFVVETDRDRRRQLFNDVNRTQKRVPKSLGVSYDSRDPIAIAVNEAIKTHPIGQLVEREKATAGRTSGKLTTSGTLYDAVATVVYGWSAKPGRRKGRTDQEAANSAAALIMDALTAMPAIEDVLAADSPADAVNVLRATSILGSGATVKAIAGALFVAHGRLGSEGAVRKAFGNLEKIDWRPSEWVAVGFVPDGGKTPHSRSQEVRAAGIAIADVLAPEVEA